MMHIDEAISYTIAKFNVKGGYDEIAHTIADYSQRAERAEQRVKELESQLKRMTDWSQNWLMAGNAITGRNDGIALRDDVNRSRALLSAAMK